MDMTGERLIRASRARVWEALNDPEILQACIPGCRSLTRDGDEMVAEVVASVGPVKATFKGRVRIEDPQPPQAYALSGEGIGGAAGFAKGRAEVRLEEIDGDTLLSYETKAQVGGKLAQLGGRLIDATARKLSGEFFDALAARLSQEATVE
ncbi:MAG: hypothetical protein JWO33_2554 [Caulobacteraceae bacterium]|nr:hypothetical protein [Caulobacteraceae bacterium]